MSAKEYFKEWSSICRIHSKEEKNFSFRELIQFAEDYKNNEIGVLRQEHDFYHKPLKSNLNDICILCQENPCIDDDKKICKGCDHKLREEYL